MDDEEKPDPERFPTQKEWAEGVQRSRERLLKERPRVFLPGSIWTCPMCGEEQMESCSNIVRETLLGSLVILHHNLHGARCISCGSEVIEAYEQIALEATEELHRVADYQAKVTSVSGRNLGTYWPKDVVRVMGLHSQDPLRIQVIDEDTMLVRRVPAEVA